MRSDQNASNQWEFPTSVPIKQIVLTLSDMSWFVTATSATRTRFPVITASLGANEKWRCWARTSTEWNAIRQFWTFVLFSESVRQLEWQVRAAGHPQTGLNPMTGFSGAKPDKHFHSITDTEGKFGCNCSYSVFLSRPGPAVSMVTVWWSLSSSGKVMHSLKLRSVLHKNVCEN